MSNKSRGNAFELKVKKYLESLGFKVDKARAKIMMIAPGRMVSGPNDFLGCADLLAVHPQRRYTLLAQCTLGDVSARQRKMETVPWNLEAQKVMLWTRQDGILSGMRVMTLQSGGWG